MRARCRSLRAGFSLLEYRPDPALPEHGRLRLGVVLEVITLLSEGFDRANPVLERLFPDLYPDDPATSAELRKYTEDDLRSAKLEQDSKGILMIPRRFGRGFVRPAAVNS